LVGPIITKTSARMAEEFEERMVEQKELMESMFSTNVNKHMREILAEGLDPAQLSSAKIRHHESYSEVVAAAGGFLDSPSVLDWAAKNRAYKNLHDQHGE